MTATCQRCGHDFEYAFDPGMILKPVICAKCHDELDLSKLAAETEKRYNAWLAFCPALYAATEPDHPAMPQDKLARVMAWPYGSRGLIGHGVTRRCKSRCFWLLIKRLVEEGRSVEAMTGGELARQCASAQSEGGSSARAWFDHLATVDVLFVDDLDKAKFTDRVLAELFDLVEHRTSHLRPFLLTTNTVGATLIDKMHKEAKEGFGFAAEPLIARIREFCESISF